jgi:predicted metal-dependent hydrolase
MTADLADDPRFIAALARLDARQYDEAGDGFEELFFEAVRDEVPFVRVFLQVSAGLYHLDLRQWRPGVERLGEAIVAIDQVTNDRGFDLAELRKDVRAAIDATRRGAPVEWPRVKRK